MSYTKDYIMKNLPLESFYLPRPQNLHLTRLENGKVATDEPLKLTHETPQEQLPNINFPISFAQSLNMYISEVLAGARKPEKLIAWTKSYIYYRIIEKRNQKYRGNRSELIKTRVSRLNKTKVFVVAVMKTSEGIQTFSETFEQEENKWVMTDFEIIGDIVNQNANDKLVNDTSRWTA